MRTWIIVFIVFVVFILILSVVPLFVPSYHYEKFIINQLAKKIPYKTEIGQVKFRLLPHPSFMLKNVVLTDTSRFSGQQFMNIEKVRADISLLALIGGDFDLELKIVKARVNVLCNEAICNVDSMFSDAEKPKKEQDDFPVPPSDIPVIPGPGAYLKGILISNAYAITDDFFIKKMMIAESEIHYFYNGIERLAVLNINAKIDPFDTGYKFAMQAGNIDNPILIVSGVLSLDKWRGVLRANSLDGYLMKIPIKIDFEYCSNCNPRLQKWSVNAPVVTPRQINALIGQFDLELPTAIDFGGKFGLQVSRQLSDDLTMNFDLTQMMIVWENIFNKQPELSQTINFKWKDGNLIGEVIFLNNKINLTGLIKDYNVEFQGNSSEFDLMALKSYLPILKDLESVVNPRIEFIATGKTYSFPEEWNFNGSIFASQMQTSNGSIDNATITINTENGLKISKIEGDVWGGHLIGSGEMIPGTSEYLKADFSVENAEINSLPIAKDFVMGLVDINFILEKDSFNETINGNLSSKDLLTFVDFENLFKNLDLSWNKSGGLKKISETIGNKINNLKCAFRKISKDEYIFDEIEADVGLAKLKLFGSAEVTNNEAFLKGTLSIPNANSIAGINTFLLLDGNLELPIIVSGNINELNIDIDEEELGIIKEQKKTLIDKAKEEQILKEKERQAARKAKTPQITKVAPEIKKPAVETKPKLAPKLEEMPVEQTPQIQKIGKDDFFKIIIGE